MLAAIKTQRPTIGGTSCSPMLESTKVTRHGCMMTFQPFSVPWVKLLEFHFICCLIPWLRFISFWSHALLWMKQKKMARTTFSPAKDGNDNLEVRAHQMISPLAFRAHQSGFLLNLVLANLRSKTRSLSWVCQSAYQLSRISTDRQFSEVPSTVFMSSRCHPSLCNQSNSMTSMACRCGDLFF